MAYLALSLTCAIWVLFDGLNRRAKVLPWVLGVAIAGPILMAVYLARRPLRRGEIREGGVAWNILKNLVILWTLLMLVVAISVAAKLGDLSNSLAFVATTLSLGMIAGIWFFPFVAAVGIAFLVKKSSIIEEGPIGQVAAQPNRAPIFTSRWIPWAVTATVWLVIIAGTVALRYYKIRRAEVFPQAQPSQPQTTTPPDVTLVRTLAGHTGIVLSVAFSPDGRTLASRSITGAIKLWDVATGREVRTLAGYTDDFLLGIESVTFSPDGRTLASGSWDDTIKLWEVATGRKVRTLKGHTNVVQSVAFSPDGRTLASGSQGLLSSPADGTLKLWEVATGREVRTLAGHTDQVTSVAFSPDGRTLASGSWDKTIKFWEVATGRLVRTLSGHTNSVFSVVFSPDGRTLASGSHDHTVKLWEVATGRELRTLAGHAKGVRSVAFSPDGRTLASGSYDNTIKLWRWEE